MALLNLNPFNGSPQLSNQVLALAYHTLLDLDSFQLRNLVSRLSPTLLLSCQTHSNLIHMHLLFSSQNTFLPTPTSFMALGQNCFLRDTSNLPTLFPKSSLHLFSTSHCFCVYRRGKGRNNEEADCQVQILCKDLGSLCFAFPIRTMGSLIPTTLAGVHIR